MKKINSENAPAAIGPYCHAVIQGNTVYCSGQIALDPATMKLSGSTIEQQTTQVIKNIEAVLIQAGSGLNKILKTTIYLKNMEEFSQMNQVYEQLLNGHTPARSTIQAAGLPKDALIEIECIASLE